MGYTVTSSSRRIVMATLLALATAGAVARYYAPDPSVLRDVGTLLLVLWLPAVGNLVGWLIRKVPRKARPAPDFAVGSAFAPQLRVLLQPVEMAGGSLARLDPAERRCTLLVGQRGFTVRLAQPLVEELAMAGEREAALELLRPATAGNHLAEGTEFYLIAGATAVAKGKITQAPVAT